MTEAQGAELIAIAERVAWLGYVLALVGCFGLAGVIWRLIILAKNQRHPWAIAFVAVCLAGSPAYAGQMDPIDSGSMTDIVFTDHLTWEGFCELGVPIHFTIEFSAKVNGEAEAYRWQFDCTFEAPSSVGFSQLYNLHSPARWDLDLPAHVPWADGGEQIVCTVLASNAYQIDPTTTPGKTAILKCAVWALKHGNYQTFQQRMWTSTTSQAPCEGNNWAIGQWADFPCWDECQGCLDDKPVTDCTGDCDGDGITNCNDPCPEDPTDMCLACSVNTDAESLADETKGWPAGDDIPDCKDLDDDADGCLDKDDEFPLDRTRQGSKCEASESDNCEQCRKDIAAALASGVEGAGAAALLKCPQCDYDGDGCLNGTDCEPFIAGTDPDTDPCGCGEGDGGGGYSPPPGQSSCELAVEARIASLQYLFSSVGINFGAYAPAYTETAYMTITIPIPGVSLGESTWSIPTTYDGLSGPHFAALELLRIAVRVLFIAWFAWITLVKVMTVLRQWG